MTDSNLNSRYARQLSLPEVGEAGQRKLAAAKILLIGAGGLGSPAALYLAGAGVGTLGLIDPDTVSLSNLQRQILYASSEAGQPKVERAAARLSALNGEITVRTWAASLNPDNARAILADFDLILDGSDNLSTRYLLSDACVQLGKPLIHGSVYRFEGQVASFVPGGPCYRCLYPEMPPPGSLPSCAEAGVLGVLPGLVGLLQASEALRLILDWGPGLSGKLLLLDLKSMDFQTLGLPKLPNCPACGAQPTITTLEPEAYPEIACPTDEIGRAEAAAKLRTGELTALDVRTDAEHAQGALPGLHIPLAELAQGLNTLNPDIPLLVYCEKGQRSARAVSLLRQHGFTRARSLRGGYAAWIEGGCAAGLETREGEDINYE